MIILKPKVIHISGGDGKLCGSPPENWSERYLSDSFARTLPICPDCKLEHRLRYGRAFRNPHRESEESIEDVEVDMIEIEDENIQEAPQTRRELKTLRAYLS